MSETIHIYNIIRHILETYDGISSDDIDYTNMATTRAGWKAGRQITEQKSSAEYLDELAQQSFLSIYPTRKGKRGVKAWREDTTVISTHGDAPAEYNYIMMDINTGKPLIYKFERDSLSRIYNEFKLNYDWNPGSGRYNKSIYITKSDEESFPEVYECTGSDTSKDWEDAYVTDSNTDKWILMIHFDDEPDYISVGDYISLYGDDGYWALHAQVFKIKQSGSDYYVFAFFDNTYNLENSSGCSSGTLYYQSTGVPDWTTFVGGSPDYATAKAWWEICHTAWQETKSINRLEYDCPWFVDNEDFGHSGGTANTVYYLLQNLLEWCTRQKYIVEYAVNLQANTLELELNDPINFNDTKYTGGTNRMGYIKQIKIVPSTKNPMMIITLLLKPYNIEELNYIIETGSAPDTITERGDEGDDTITEGQQLGDGGGGGGA